MTLLVVASFLAGTFVPTVWTQQGPVPGECVVVNLMSVAPGGGANYVAMERNVYKASHQARVSDKKWKSWSRWQLRFGGREIPYPYATINTYNKREDIDLGAQEYLQKANPDRDLAAIQQQTQAAR